MGIYKTLIKKGVSVTRDNIQRNNAPQSRATPPIKKQPNKTDPLLFILGISVVAGFFLIDKKNK